MTLPIAAAVAISGAMLPLAAAPLDASATDGPQQPTPIKVTSLAIAPPASDSTFRLNDTIRVTVTFDKQVEPLGASRIAIDMEGTIRNAHYDSGAGTTSLVFVYVVQPGDADPTGISIATDALKGLIHIATVEKNHVTDVFSAAAESALSNSFWTPALGAFAITNDPRYKVLGTRQPPIACDIPEGVSSSHRKDVCALQIVVAAIGKWRTDHHDRIRSNTDTLNAKCEESDSSNIINHKYVQKALSHLNLGRQVYCRERIRRMVVVSDILIKAHEKYNSLGDPGSKNIDRLSAIGDDIDALLESEGLYKTFKSSAQISILSYADVPGSRDDNDDDDATEAVREYKALWHTRPLAKHVVFYGAFGHGSLFKTRSATLKNDNACQCDDSSSVQYAVNDDKGMYYSIGVKYFPVRHRLAVLLSGGQTRSSMKDTMRVEDKPGMWTSNQWNNWFDFGVNLQLFDVNDTNVIDYIDKRPAVNAEIGLRWDSKYRSKYRYFWRFSVDFREVLGFRKENDKESGLLSAVLVVEGDSGRFFGHGGGSEWPSTRRLQFFIDTKADLFTHLPAG